MVKVSEFPAVNSVVSRRRSGVRTKKPTPPREEERLRIWPQGVCPGGRLDMGLQLGGKKKGGRISACVVHHSGQCLRNEHGASRTRLRGPPAEGGVQARKSVWSLGRLRSAPSRGRGQAGRGYGAWSRRRLREGGWREARFPFVQIRHFARQRQWRRRRRLEPLIGFRGPVLEPISAGSEPGERGTVSMRSQYPAAQSRPQRPDWRVSLTTQERPRRPSSRGCWSWAAGSPGSEPVEARRGGPAWGWHLGARLLSGCWWRLHRCSPILGSREGRWPTDPPRAVAVSPGRSSLILRPVLVSPRSGPR